LFNGKNSEENKNNKYNKNKKNNKNNQINNSHNEINNNLKSLTDDSIEAGAGITVNTHTKASAGKVVDAGIKIDDGKASGVGTNADAGKTSGAGTKADGGITADAALTANPGTKANASITANPGTSTDVGINKKGKWARLALYKKILIIFFSVLFFLLATVFTFLYFYMQNANKTISAGTSTEIENLLTPLEEPRAPVTILMLGRDTRDAENERGRADTIMLLHLDPKQKRAAVLSIPRDTLVDIPGYGKDKINAAYAYGGEELMIKTVSNFLDAVINHYITIDFEGFVKLIDELGGVDVVIDRPIEDPKSGAFISAGNHHFTGEQALAYTRTRSTELGDIARIQRQQYILKELVKQKLNLKNIANINTYFNIVINNVKTDLDLMTILSYAKSALSISPENIETAIIPTHPEWIDNGTKSVQIPDVDEAKAMWERIIFGQPISQYNIQYLSGYENIPDSMGNNQEYKFNLKIKNTGTTTWEKTGDNPYYLSYHWLDFNTKKAVVFEGKRTYLPIERVEPGGEVEVEMKILAPPESGNYILQIDMVREGITWFSYQGIPTLEKFVSVNVVYSATYNDNGTTPKQVKPGQTFTTKVTVKNNGFMTWQKDVDNKVRLGAHWLNRDTREIVEFGLYRANISGDIERGQTDEIEITITAPKKPGRYILAYDLVHEKVTWFSHKGVVPFEVNVDVGITLDNSIAKKTSVVIYNGCGIAGAASDFKDYIKGYNFIISDIANAKSFDFTKTLIIYKENKKANAEQLSHTLISYEMEEYSDKWKDYKTKADIIVIVGSDYKDNISWQDEQ